jgi:hypothetical protein
LAAAPDPHPARTTRAATARRQVRSMAGVAGARKSPRCMVPKVRLMKEREQAGRDCGPVGRSGKDSFRR